MADVIIDLTKETIRESVYAEVSKVADKSYDDGGGSQYDGVIFTSSDYGLIDGFISDACLAFAKRMFEECSFTDDTAKASFSFNLPDFDTSFKTGAEVALERFVVLTACASWFRHALPSRAEEYAARGLAAMDLAASLLHGRKAPTITRA